MTRGWTIFGWWMALLSLAMLGRCGCAQEKPDSPEPKTTQTAQSPSKTETKDKDQEANDEVPKRIFWIIPNFMTANDQSQNLGPLTPKQKFKHCLAPVVSAHIGNLLQASISPAANGIPEYGQGWGAFGQRCAAQEGHQFTGAMLIYGVLPTVLHDDPAIFARDAVPRYRASAMRPRAVSSAEQIPKKIPPIFPRCLASWGRPAFL
jgi:hypothetical protein